MRRRNRPMTIRRAALVCAVLCSAMPDAVADDPCAAAAPLRVANLNPFHLVYGIPGSFGTCVLPPGASELIASLDVASHLGGSGSARERLALDGETWRPALAVRSGFRDDWEHFIELSAVSHNRGMFDGFIEIWHSVFGLPQGGRDRAPRDRLSIVYARDGAARVEIDRDTLALGDVALGLGHAVGLDGLSNDGLALRAAVRLPTGNSAALAGSGGVSASVWGETSGTLFGGSRAWLYGATLGILAADPPDALPPSGGRLVGFARAVVTWRLLTRLSLKVQVDANTSPYGASSLAHLADPAVMIGMGGTVRIGERTTLEVAVVEDDGVHRAVPDVGLHLALRWRP